MEKEISKQYIYIVQATLEPSKCKIGKTNDLERRLNEYNKMTGKSKDNIYKYLFTCEVADMSAVAKDMKAEFPKFREQKSREIYFFNNDLFADYVEFIKNHALFVKEIPLKQLKEKVIIVKEKAKSLTERSMTQDDLLRKAKKKATAIQKDNTLSGVIEHDEFYTRYEDIEKEVENYKDFFANKVVFCNCDDPYLEGDEEKSSAFAVYFYRNFNKLKIKKLICLHYAEGGDIFKQGKSGIIYTTDGKKWQTECPAGFNGSFSHARSLKILKEEADIVCTNPPFSLSRQFWKLVIESKKNFLIISNLTCCVNTFYIPYFIKKAVWAGHNQVFEFINEKGLTQRAAAGWFTNFAIKSRNNYKNFKFTPIEGIPSKYKKIDDNKILLVDNGFIPNDYENPFAVSQAPIFNGILEKGYQIVQNKRYTPYINGKEKFARVLIQKKNTND